MTIGSQLLAWGRGWRVSAVVCTAGPHDPSFEERHDFACIAAVTEGSFQYRSARGAAVLSPGALLLANQGEGFECGHEHGIGDRCLAFHFTQDSLEEIISAVPGAPRMAFTAPRLPPVPRLMSLTALAETARNNGDGAELEELAFRLAGAVVGTLADARAAAPRASQRDERRISDALRRIEAEAEEPLSLSALAQQAAMSRYHFLRVFRTLVGLTPHQYLLRTRLHRAAVRLRNTDDPVSSIAFGAGFNDLSSFNRRFRRVMGINPAAYRARRASII